MVSASNTKTSLAKRFRLFARRECRESAPLYARLALGVAGDDDVLTLASGVPQGQPPPNLLFAAVHYLLLGGAEHPLGAFYPSLEGGESSEDPYPHFRAFCLEHEKAIADLIARRRVQTNEVGRCAYMMPTYSLIARRQKGRPLALVDVGASAGLNLLWDRYGYDYGEEGRFGDSGSPVQLSCMLRGPHIPSFPSTFPEVVLRLGIDIEPVDLADVDQADWLCALVWPEHVERLKRQRAAVCLTQKNPPQVIEGDAADILPQIESTIPREAVLCLCHNHVLYQFSRETLKRYRARIEDLSAGRDLYWISSQEERLELIAYEAGRKEEMLLAHCDGHGRWLEWRARDGP